jgi:hypothetical protein
MAGGQNNRRGHNRASQWTAAGFIDAGYISVSFAVENAFRRAVSGKHFRMRMPERSCPVRQPGSRRLLKNTNLLRYAHPSSLQRTTKYASFLVISRALHLDVFDQPAKNGFFKNLLGCFDLSLDPCRFAF